MNSQAKTSAKDFFLNLGAIVAIYTVVISLINLLFTVINRAYPQINSTYNYFGSQSISWPVAILIIFFPIFVLLMWLLEKGYVVEPDKRHIPVRRWLTYITLFIAGLAMAIDLVTILYFFIDGQELTVAFFLKVLSVLIVTLLMFLYYISDIRGKLNGKSRIIWMAAAVVIILASIIWGFVVLGSPRTQRLYKYDAQKINDLINIDSAIQNYYSSRGMLPETLGDLSPNFYIQATDLQFQKPYQFEKTGSLKYNLCAEFNKPSLESSQVYQSYPYGKAWVHQTGRQCFGQTINPNLYSKPIPAI